MFGNRSGNGLLTAGGVIVVLIAAGLYLATRDDGVITQGDVASVVVPSEPAVVSRTELPEQSTVALPQTEAAPEGAIETEEVDTAGIVQQMVTPSFDEVRVDNSGAMVVAGRGTPGETVDILVDGEVIATSLVDASGAFAALGLLDPNDAARLLTLRVGDGETAVISAEEIILAPVSPAPVIAGSTAQEGPDSGEVAAPATQVAEADTDTAATVQEDTAAVATGPVTSPEEAPTQAVVTPQPSAPLEQANASGTATPSAPEAAPASSEVAVLRSDEAGVTLVPTQPQPTQTVVLDTIGYSDQGAVQLGGRAETGTVEVRAYLNNRAVARLPVDAQGNWRGEVPQVDAGVYTLRVDAVSADGTVASRIETPFKREEPAVLAAATLDGEGPVQAVTVQTGDTLWAIARDRYGEGLLYVQVFEANRASIRNPDLIYPGQVFELPAD